MKNWKSNLVQLIDKDFDFFSHLSWRMRSMVVLALTSLFLTLSILTHLTVYPYLTDSSDATFFISMLYIYILILAVLTITSILIPRFRFAAILLIFLICAMNFFPLILLALLVPILRRNISVIIAITIYCSISVTGAVFIYKGRAEGVLFQQPEPMAVALWISGVIAIFAGIFIYGYITQRISRDKTRIETEIQIAHDMQTRLVPDLLLDKPEYQLYGKTTSASEIGGDFFDVIALGERDIIIAVGDVSGHNIAAGITMAITKGAFRTALNHTDSLAEIAASMNHSILTNSDKKMFVTFKCARVDFDSRMLTVVNAGHLPLLHFQNETQTIHEHNRSGLALGLSKAAVYETQTIDFESGDCFFLLTDGIIEAMNASREEFGLSRTKQVLTQLAGSQSPQSIHEQLSNRLRDFRSATSLEDDATFLGVKMTS